MIKIFDLKKTDKKIKFFIHLITQIKKNINKQNLF